MILTILTVALFAYFAFMVSTLIIMYVSKCFYRGYLLSQKKHWDDMSQLDFELKFMKVSLFPLLLAMRLSSYAFEAIGARFGKLFLSIKK